MNNSKHEMAFSVWSGLFSKDSSSQERDFFDVTLAHDDDAQIESRKVIRWAWRLFFHKVLLHNVGEEHDLFDVTLARDDDPQLEAHTVIHWAWSLFFHTILMHNAEEEPRLFDATLAYDDDSNKGLRFKVLFDQNMNQYIN